MVMSRLRASRACTENYTTNCRGKELSLSTDTRARLRAAHTCRGEGRDEVRPHAVDRGLPDSCLKKP